MKQLASGLGNDKGTGRWDSLDSNVKDFPLTAKGKSLPKGLWSDGAEEINILVVCMPHS